MNEKVKFRTQYDRERIYSHVGSREKTIYTPEFDRHGHFELVATGKENLYEYIQSFKESVDINVILKRFANGDTSALSKTQGMYGDFTQSPKTYAEMLDRITKAEAYFQSLPVETREKFDHNFGKFVAEMGSEAWLDTVGLKPAEPVEPAAPTTDGKDDLKVES